MKNNLVIFCILMFMLYSAPVSADKYWAKIQKMTVDQQKILRSIQRENDELTADKDNTNWFQDIENVRGKSL